MDKAEAMPADPVITWFRDHPPRPADESDGDSAVIRTVRRFREMVAGGGARPGHHLRERELAEALGVSRNTLREAFRLLAHEELVVHRLNRGVFIRRITAGDIADIFRVRRLVELDAVRRANGAPRVLITPLTDILDDADRAVADRRWTDVATADIRWHQAITQLTGSRRLQETMTRVLAELRLAFAAYGSSTEQERFHRPYLAWNRQITELILVGDTEAAETALAAYLARAERQLLAAYRTAAPGTLSAEPSPGAPSVEQFLSPAPEW
ncbi:GntR family transcriptional regulator [Actinomadura spongiicola]|uniref:GntR family transcriptional regulator n=1 Tax=Actinomadura spongiicola TaxID=2303421 RepID=A0A372GP66_9ACTN|nr:GntR family transcriptional regulator [Actinomadura spongiicola]RFS86899.1 GntR family transcriptional regulator [Actinomadura spongiicola]